MAGTPAANGSVQSVERAFNVLELMATAGEAMGVSQLAEASSLPMPTIHRFARTLTKLGYVRQFRRADMRWDPS